ncbi:MAG: RagB/SusD family nutrient uptake outer membrane protein [Chitinophagaceae bacterium]|nr:MAG: RagB/SusD family nutrient uptake outer membrane protein [Chitinophagaceae bacterium]
MERKEFLGLLSKGLIGSSLLVSGCSKLLNVTNPNNVTPENFWKTASDAEANITSIYGVFLGQAGWSCANNWYNRRVVQLYRGDDIGITHDVPDWWSLALFTTADGSSTAQGLWSQDYQGIFFANQAIQNIPNINMDSSTKTRLVGEAKFFRAFFYFDLLTNFLNIPLIVTVPENSSQYSQPQAQPSDVWKQIEADLNDAIAALPATYNTADLGRITKGAALGYLGKSYLYQKMWQQASSTFEQIISSNTYSLLPNYPDVFGLNTPFNAESLLEIAYADTTFQGEPMQTPRNYEEAPSQAGGWYECYPNQFLFNEMTKEKTVDGNLDPRIYTTIIFPGSGLLYYGKTYEQLFGSGATQLSWAKYNQCELPHPLDHYSGKHTRLLRYSDVLLMHAEALNNQNQVQVAIPFVNQVRNRAKLANLPVSMTQSELMSEIEHQRIVELADEGNRFYDLLRWGTIQENLTAHGAIGAANFVKGKNEYLPIPSSEMQTNTKAKQNPGY